MDVSTGSWFKYLSEQILTEGLDDIGLPEVIVNDLRGNLPEPVSEKARMWVGDIWKNISPNSPDAGLWISDSDRYRDGLVTAIETWTNNNLVDKGDTRFTATAEEFEGATEDKVAFLDYKDWHENLQKKIKDIDTLLGDYPKILRKSLKTLNKLLLKAEKERVYPFNPDLWLTQDDSSLPIARIKGGYEILFDKNYSAYFQALFDDYKSIFTALNEDPSFYDEIKGYGTDAIGRVKTKADELLGSLEEDDKVILSYDDGTYWYNLQESKCSLAKERNFNCGDAYLAEEDSNLDLPSDLTLIELRYKDPKKPGLKHFKSFVMISYSPSEDAFYQIKGNREGQGNIVPTENTWPKIIDLIGDLGITQLYETGRHSKEVHLYPAFLEHLEDQTGVELAAPVEEEPSITAAWAEAEEELNSLDEREYDNVHFNWEENDVDTEDNTVDLTFTGGATFSIPLGWEGFAVNRGGTRYFEPDDPDDPGEFELGIKPIPMEHWRTDISIEAEDLLPQYIAGAHVNVSYNVDTDRNEIDFALEATENVQYNTETVTEASDEYERFIDSLVEEVDERFTLLKERLRVMLLEQGHMRPSGWDDIKKEILNANEKGDFAPNFTVTGGDKEDPHELVATFLMNPGRGSGESIADTGIVFPKSFKNWNKRYLIDSDLEKVFYSQLAPGVISQYSNRVLRQDGRTYQAIATTLNSLQKQVAKASSKQAELPLGDKYAPPLPQMVNVFDIMEIRIGLSPSGGVDSPDKRVTLSPKFIITSDMGPEEAQSAYDLVRWMNNNSDQIREIIKKTLTSRIEHMQTQQREDLAVDEGDIMMMVQRIMGDAENFAIAHGPDDPNFNPQAFKRWVVAKWIQTHWPEFTEVEKLAAGHQLMPMYDAGMPPELDPRLDDQPPQDSDFEEGRKGKRWEDHVKKAMAQMNAVQTAGLSGFDYRWDRRRPTQRAEPEWQPGMPTPANESIEDQIERIDKLLQEKDPTYDLRIYSIRLDCSIAKDRGGEMQETQTEIRGIEGVTTVRTMGDARRGPNQSWMATLEIKFELLGAIGRVKYRDRILVPGLMRVKGLTILRLSPMHRTNKRGTIRTVRESKKKELYEFAYTDYNSPKMVTPAVSLDGVLEDWVEGGVQVYDVPTNTTDMQYHVMVPVEELWPYASRMYRGTKTDFDGRYKYFIKDGAMMPVYVALGQNGRIKVTGNEDYIWFAKKSGLKELPVFFSYQKQV